MNQFRCGDWINWYGIIAVVVPHDSGVRSDAVCIQIFSNNVKCIVDKCNIFHASESDKASVIATLLIQGANN